MRLPFEGQYKITQMFGENPPLYAKFGLKGHNGLDFATPQGTTILSPHNGTIREAYFDSNGYGWYVKIENDKEGSVLAHHLANRVTIGQLVNEGQEVAISDSTGYSTGDHCHWGYYKFPRDRQNGYNGFIDQYSLVQHLLTPQTHFIQVEKKTYEELITKLDKQDRTLYQIKQLLSL